MYLIIVSINIFNPTYNFHLILFFIKDGFNPPSTKLNQSQYAARISHHALNFRKDLFDGKLDPDFLGKGKSPLCMNSYR